MTSAPNDPYDSRADPHWSFAERYDPVIWGLRKGPLTPAELVQYERRGYLVKRDLFSPGEVNAILADAERMLDGEERDGVVLEPTGNAVRSLFRVHVGDGLTARLTRAPRLCAVARQVLGSDVYLHQSRINFKPAFEGKPFPWHSDFETWHMEDGMPRMRALSASVLLTPNTEHNGPLLVVPGSHRRFVRCVGKTPEQHFTTSLREQRVGVPAREALAALVEAGSIDSITGPAGTVVFFDCNLMHGSAGNITPLPRHNMFLVYNSCENKLRDPYCGLPARPGFLAEREAAPIA